MSDDKHGFFKVKSITNISDLKEGTKIPESDLTIQDDGKVIQFDHVEPDDDAAAEVIKVGSFNIEDTAMGIKLKKLKLKSYNLLKSVNNTAKILAEADKFFKKFKTPLSKVKDKDDI